jgi:hypothetical protein
MHSDPFHALSTIEKEIWKMEETGNSYRIEKRPSSSLRPGVTVIHSPHKTPFADETAINQTRKGNLSAALKEEASVPCSG